MNSGKSIKYGARLACIADLAASGQMERTDFSKESILKAIRSLHGNTDKKIQELWSMISNMQSGVGNKDIEENAHWKLELVEKYYNHQKREIMAINAIVKNFEDQDCDLFETANILNVYVWKFKHIMEYRERIPWTMVLTIEKLGYSFTFEELKAEWDNTAQEFGGYI